VSASVAQSVASGAKIVSQDSTVTSSNTATVVIPAQASVSFGPNGSKVLLTGLVSPLKTGDTVVLSLGFVNAGVISVTAKVQSS
jgi:copper(I)-binding protein